MTTPSSERTLILLRHSKAEHVHGKRDHDRELASRGCDDARAAGRWLSAEPLVGAIELALCSTSERTRQTLDEVCAAGAAVSKTRFDERIYNAHAAGLLDVLHEVPDSVTTVLMVGHAPGVPVLAMALAQDATGPGDVDERWTDTFPTSGLAVLAFGGQWAELAPDVASLCAFVVPRG